MPSASSAVPSAAARGDESQPSPPGQPRMSSLVGTSCGPSAAARPPRCTGPGTWSRADVAIKSFPNPGAGGRECEGSAAIERGGHPRRLRHRHVVRLHEILGTRKKVHCLDLAGGELFSLVDLTAACRRTSRGITSASSSPPSGRRLRVGAVADGNPPHLCGTRPTSRRRSSKQGYHPPRWTSGPAACLRARCRLPPFNDASLINMYRKIYAGRFRCPNWFSPALVPPAAPHLDPNSATHIDTDDILDHPCFCHGAGGDGELAKLMRGPEEEAWFKTESQGGHGADMTAFDILAFSPGLRTSGLFWRRAGHGAGVRRGAPPRLCWPVEDAGRSRHRVRREGRTSPGRCTSRRRSAALSPR
ncbi:hypothetical protein ZWY2020_038016 [Hordeum vulgare]|nr:hypothetical protein ZWY2020_038016 [Hordeum vulgare]